jgi:uncharacterized protein
MREIFINDFGRLRSGWRFLIYIVLVMVLTIPSAAVVRIVFFFAQSRMPSETAAAIAQLAFRATLLAAALAVGYFCARFIEGLPWRSLGLTFHSGWLRDLILGFAIGFATLVVAVAIASKGLRFSIPNSGWSPIIRSMIGSGVLFFVGALAEEAMFRGYGLQTMMRAKLAGLGILLTSVPFGLVHLSNPNVVFGITFTNTALAGIWFAAGYLRTRSLWLPVGAHWSWNWALGWFFGLPVSGLNIIANPLLEAQDIGPKWLTGGSYGIEGGVACMIALILFTAFLWKTRWLSATPELKQMTSEENPAISNDHV